MKKVLLVFVLFTVTISLLVVERHRIVFALMFPGSPPELLSPTEEGKDVTWHDDYYLIRTLDSSTFAIGEPRYYQQNINYLIVGSERAILFDAGSGGRDIRSVATALTDRPITFVPSHFHFDHVGNGISFDRVAIVDLPHLRSRAEEGLLMLECYLSVRYGPYFYWTDY